jgi:hypothetical protein
MIHLGLAGGPVYLDYNATTPVDPAALEAALPYLAVHLGNPPSGHRYAEGPRAAVERARAQVAELLGAQPGEIVFTGGGSEADTLAVRGAALAAPTNRRHVITLPTEHPAVLQACRSLQGEGFTVTKPAGRRVRPCGPRQPGGRDHRRDRVWCRLPTATARRAAPRCHRPTPATPEPAAGGVDVRARPAR